MPRNPRLQAGDQAPQITVTDVHGAPAALADRWSNSPTLITFLRHFG
ncbi:MAG: hypothetical protein L6Q98_12180 [Anaerolineae bacterium]|nr:hypothetical protein [Anaerolineae bacterium]NUQ06404.1 hypothetical protein [Anaerolineae bacterium]